MSSLDWLADVKAEPVEGSAIAVVVAHPDDETIGCGGLISRLRNVNVVVVTDGAPADLVNARRAGFASARDYALARAGELNSALSIAGVAERRLYAMGAEDGGVWRSLVSITHRLAAFVNERGVETILTHAFEGGHSDHDGVAYCVHLAAGLMLGRAPTIIEMPFYHQGADGPVFQSFCDGEEGRVTRLTPEQIAKKREMFAVFASQKHILDRIEPSVERFRIAKAYDFRSPPNCGAMRYGRRAADLGLPAWMRGSQGRVSVVGGRDRRAAWPKVAGKTKIANRRKLSC